jgi:exosortase/archaeosortase family protein
MTVKVSRSASPALFGSALVRFFVIMLAVYAGWFVLYDLWLHPDGRLDAALSRWVAVVTAGALRVVGYDVFIQDRVLGLVGFPGVYVEDGCTGLTTLGLFAGFVLAFPGAWRRRAWFIPLGVVVITLANIARIGLLAVLQRDWPAGFDAVHHFGANTFFYLVVFALWVIWANAGGEAKRGRPAEPALQSAPA